MIRRLHRSHCQARRTGLLAGLFLCCAFGHGCHALAQTGRSFIPQPSTEAATIGVGERQYLVLGEEAVLFPLTGPGTFWGFARIGFAPAERTTRSATLVLRGLADRIIRIPLDFKPGRGDAAWGEHRPDRPSGGRRFEIHVPAGTWTVGLSGIVSEPGFLTAIVY